MQGNMNNTAFGQAFLKKVAEYEGKLPENFFVYEAGWIEAGPPELWNTMQVKGCQFREAKIGPNKGEICIPVRGTEYMLCVTKEEVRQAEIDMAVNTAVEDDFSDEQMEEMRKLEEEQRINEIKRKVQNAYYVYTSLGGGYLKHYKVGCDFKDTFTVIDPITEVPTSVKYSDVPASAKFFELVEMK